MRKLKCVLATLRFFKSNLTTHKEHVKRDMHQVERKRCWSNFSVQIAEEIDKSLLKLIHTLDRFRFCKPL